MRVSTAGLRSCQSDSVGSIGLQMRASGRGTERGGKGLTKLLIMSLSPLIAVRPSSRCPGCTTNSASDGGTRSKSSITENVRLIIFMHSLMPFAQYPRAGRHSATTIGVIMIVRITVFNLSRCRFGSSIAKVHPVY